MSAYTMASPAAQHSPKVEPETSQALTLSLLILCLVMAALLRFSALDLMEYKIDQSKTLKQASQVVEEGTFLTRAEISSKGMPHPPLYVYIVAPIWAATANPLVVARFFALLNVATVGLTYWVGRRYLSPRAGLIAAVFMAVSPWAVVFSRNIWRGDMMPILGALIILATLQLVVEGRRRAIFWVCLWAAVAAQVHQTGYPVAAAALVFILIFRPRISRPALVLGVIVVAILYVPYIVFIVDGGWRLLLDFFMGRAPCVACTPPSSLAQQLEPIWHLTNLGNFPYLIGETSYYLEAKLGAAGLLIYPIATLQQVGFMLGLGWLGWRILRPRGEHQLRAVGLLSFLCFFSLAVPCLLSSWRCLPQYYTVILVFPFLVLGAAMDGVLTSLRAVRARRWAYRWASGFTGVALASVILTQVYFSTTFFSLLNANGGTSGEYGVSYNHKVSLANHLAQAYGPGCYELNHEWDPLINLGVRSYEMDDLVKYRAKARPCPEGSPAQLYVLEILDRPLSPEAEEALKPYQRFGPVVLYSEAVQDVR